MAGTAGIEPANAWTKTMCLTTWRRPDVVEDSPSTFTSIAYSLQTR